MKVKYIYIYSLITLYALVRANSSIAYQWKKYAVKHTIFLFLFKSIVIIVLLLNKMS